ncbi:MAG: hypothetical protein U0414_13865 [Polyangiaceae bacterium]
MWRLPNRPHHALRDGAVLEGYCVVCGAVRALPEQELSRAVRGDLPRDFDVHRHCLVACSACGTPYLVDTWYALPRGPWQDDSFTSTLDAMGNAIGRGASRAADAMENGVRWAMGERPRRREAPPSARDEGDLDAVLRSESSLLEDPLEAKFRALEEAAKKKP